MRIIAGKFGRRRLKTPKNLLLRPTTDIAKEGLFNILNNRIYFDEQKVLDLFAGTGSISFEFISRDAEQVTCVENNLVHFKFITSVKNDLNMENLQPLKTDVFKFLGINKQSYSLIFADPPFDLDHIETLPGLIFNGSHLTEDGIFILEHSDKHNFEKYEHFVELRKYGKVHFSFFGRSH